MIEIPTEKQNVENDHDEVRFDDKGSNFITFEMPLITSSVPNNHSPTQTKNNYFLPQEKPKIKITHK